MKKIKKSVLKKREIRKLKREYREKLEEWKRKVIERDNSTCQLCGKQIVKKGSLHCHHIIANCKKYKELSTDVMNGVLLDPRCHKFADDCPHQNAFAFVFWLKRYKPAQFHYLLNYMETKW